jgi:20S proteasome subunit alpha 7
VKCLDGIVLGAEKLVFSKLLVEGTNRRLYNLDDRLGLALCGKIPDGRHIMDYARGEAKKYAK